MKIYNSICNFIVMLCFCIFILLYFHEKQFQKQVIDLLFAIIMLIGIVLSKLEDKK